MKPKKKIKRPPFTLEETWKYCLAMWKWIAKNYKKDDDISALKEFWMEKNNFSDCDSNCFFCEFADRKNPSAKDLREMCNNCPGKLVFKSFSCMNPSYDYDDYPVKFYKKLVQLNKIRKGKAIKKR